MAIANAKEEIFSALINVAMGGKYAEIDELFKASETVMFDSTYFRYS